MISIVTVYNNKQSLEEILLESLKNQTAKFELITLDSTKGKFRSAAEAFNRGGKKANGKYIMFVHSDVDLSSNTWLEDAEKILNSIENLGIAGVAGMSEKGSSNKERGRNVIKHKYPPVIWSWGNPIQKPEPVQTLDECLTIIPKSVFNILQFDEKTCDDWHLYDVDYCLSCKRLGFEVYAIPMFIYHKSVSLSKSRKTKLRILKSLISSQGFYYPDFYYQSLKKVLSKHRNYFKWIYTTCGDWNTSYPLILQRVWSLLKAGLKYPFKRLFRFSKKIAKQVGIIKRLFIFFKKTVKKKCKNIDVYVNALKNKYGLEIGGPSSYFRHDIPLYPHIKGLDGCNFSEKTIWHGKSKGGWNYKYDESGRTGFLYISDTVNLSSIEESKYDFIITCHVLEHIANPIKAFKEWIRVIKNDGYLLVIIPHRDGTFDHKRQITPLGHLISDYNEEVGEDDLSHLDEILNLHDLSMDKPAGDSESLRVRSLDNFNNRCFHHHVFDTNSVLQLFDYLNLQICTIDLMKPYHIIVLAKKLAKVKSAENSEFLDSKAEWRKSSPFLTDRSR